jgi:copper chaperone CopZ
LNFAGCAREIEKSLGKLVPIIKVEASYVTQTATITYDETKLSEVQLKEMVNGCSFGCGEPLTESIPALSEVAHAHHHHHEMQHGTASATMEHVDGHAATASFTRSRVTGGTLPIERVWLSMVMHGTFNGTLLACSHTGTIVKM